MAKQRNGATTVPPPTLVAVAPPPPSYLNRASAAAPSAGSADPPSLSLIGQVGLGAFALALFLAPVLGGTPAGSQYGSDAALGAVRLLILVSALLFQLTLPPSTDAKSRSAKLAHVMIWTTFALTLVSLLVHSRFLTSPILLFAQVPATLDYLCYALAFSLCARLALNRALGLVPIGAIGAGLVWCAIAGAIEYAGFKQDGQLAHRTQGTFFSPNFTAGFYGLCLPVAVAAFVGARERLATFGLGAASALVFGLLVATGSRAGVLLTLAGLALALVLALAFKALGSGRTAFTRIGALAVLFALFGVAFRGPLLSRVSGDAAQGGGGAQASAAATGTDQSSDFRKWTWRGAMQMAHAYVFFGAGPGTFPARYPPFALVAKTDLAHSSYLQVADEQGTPAMVAAIFALGAAWVAAVGAANNKARRGETATIDEDTGAQPRPVPVVNARLLACGLTGGLVVGAARSLFDSEWSVLGNGLSFWAVAGLAAGMGIVPRASAAPKIRDARWKTLGALGLAAAFAAGLLSFLAASSQDAVVATVKTGQPPAPASVSAATWPPQPELFFYGGRPEETARIEPSGRQFFRLARLRERRNDAPGAIEAFKQAVKADPNNTQAWKALAEAQENTGDRAGALASWRRLVAVHESPAGRVRAIPELADTFPAYAYYALARGAAASGDTRGASDLYAKAAQVVEDYSRTPPLYQAVEFSIAASADVVLERRDALRRLYGNIIAGQKKTPPPDVSANALNTREAETLRRLNAFATTPGAN